MLVSVVAQKITHHNPIPKLVEYTLVEGFNYTTKSGEVKRVNYINENMQPSRLTITKDFVFDLSKPTDRHNYTVLKAHMLADPTLRETIKINDPVAIATNKVQKERVIMDVKAKLFDNESNLEFLARIHRRIIGFTKGLSKEVILGNLLNKTESDPYKVAETMSDADIEYYGLLDRCFEAGILKREGNTVRDQEGKLISADLETAVYKLKDDPDFHHLLENLLSGGLKREVTHTSLDRMAEINSDKIDELVMDIATEIGSIDEISADDLTIEDINPEVIESIITRALDTEMIEFIKKAGPKTSHVIKVESIFPGSQFKLGELASILEKNPGKAIEFKAILDQITNEED